MVRFCYGMKQTEKMSLKQTEKMSLFRKKSCYIIVGASKGLGKNIAVNFAKKANNESVFLLLSRNTQLLEVVKSEINTSCPQLKVVTQQFDQGELDETKFANVFETTFSQSNLSKDNFQQAVIVHNAATLGDISKFTRDMSNVDQLKTYFDINLTGTILLNTAFLKFFTQDKCPARYVVNMSSLTAIQPFKNLSLYCTGKAARDMFFKVVAEEEPSLRVLCYDPGTCATDMQIECREKSADPEVKQMFQSLHDEGKIVECDASIQKLIQLLETDTFLSGAHINYFDL